MFFPRFHHLHQNNTPRELTVESILAIGAPPANFGGNAAYSSEGIPDMIESDSQVARRLSEHWNGPAAVAAGIATPSSSSSLDPSRRGHMIVLPDDFLRVPGKVRRDGMDDGTLLTHPPCHSSLMLVTVLLLKQQLTDTQQIEADAQIARMMADEMFLRELRDNPEFERYTRHRQQRVTAHQGYPAHNGDGELSQSDVYVVSITG